MRNTLKQHEERIRVLEENNKRRDDDISDIDARIKILEDKTGFKICPTVEIKMLYEKGMSIKNIANMMSVSESTVRRKIKSIPSN